MAHIVGDLAKYFQFDEVNIDNWHFKLYYKGCVLLFFTGSMVGVLSNYFGDPIQCDFSGIDADVASDYCWIHGSSFISPEYQPHMKCIADLEGVASEDDAPDTSYYQWVTFMQLFQAGMFILPYTIWKSMEGGLLQSFGQDGKSAVLLSEEAKYSDGTVMEAVVEKYVKYFKSVLHHNQWYFAKYLFCELLNYIFLFVNFWATNKFLLGKFSYYGIEAVRWAQLTKAEKRVRVSPFCAVFPTEVSCTVPNIGAAGGEQDHNGMCVLSQNIINEKIYLIIWFYMAFLVVFSSCYLFYRLCTLFFDQLRFLLIFSKCSHKYDDDVRKSLKFVLGKCYMGDWFLLYQLSKNVNTYFFRAFVKELRNEMRDKPKRTRSLRSDNGKDFRTPLSLEEAATLPRDAKNKDTHL